MIPKLNDKPKYEITIPSTKKMVRFRPYLVREEKVLLTAFESGDKRQGLRAVVDTIVACSEEELDPKSLTMYDVEYLFTKIRAKSAGEVVNFNAKCKHCQLDNPVEIDIDAVEMKIAPQRKKIKITDEITVEVAIPGYLDVLKNEELIYGNNENLRMINSIAESITTFFTPDSRVEASDEKFEDIMEFVESLDEAQFRPLADFVNTGPTMIYRFGFDCLDCGKHSDYEVKDARTFF
jgi:hypothetical protein